MVHPDYQRRGFARQLLEACAELWTHGAQRAVLQVVTENVGARPLYASAGFTNFEREVFYVMDVQPVPLVPYPSAHVAR